MFFYQNYFKSSHFLSRHFQLGGALVKPKAGSLSVELVSPSCKKTICEVPAWYKPSADRVVIDGGHDNISVLEGNLLEILVKLEDDKCHPTFTRSVEIYLRAKDCTLNFELSKQSLGSYSLMFDTTNRPGKWQYLILAKGLVVASTQGEFEVKESILSSWNIKQ